MERPPHILDDLATTERGTGPRAVLMLHGFLGSGRNLASLARLWSDADPALRLVLVDLPGHGDSPPLAVGEDLTTAGARVVRLARRLGDGPVPVVGHSLGGRVALAARALAPEAIGPVALLDIAPGPIHAAATLDHVLSALLDAPDTAPSRTHRAFREHFAARGVPAPLIDWLLTNLEKTSAGDLTWRFDRRALAAFDARTRGVDLWPALARADAPTLCLRGGQSPFVSEADVMRLRDLGVAVTIIPEAGHFIHIDAPRAVIAALACFLGTPSS